MGPVVFAPSPPAFLDPLTAVDTCYYYTVPKFFGQNHPNTRWLITMIRCNEEDRLKHKMETSPQSFKGVYYQMMDYPQLYIPSDVTASPMFKRQAVVYLTTLGMALYLGNVSMVELLLGYRDVYDGPVCDPTDPQYATHLQDTEVGDFHAFPPFLVMMRRSCFGCAQALLKNGWDPSKPIAMPLRRKFERRVLYFRDWLEVVLAVLAARPMYPLQCLVREMIKGNIYKPVMMPISTLLPPNPEVAEPFGLIGVDELPEGIEMIGVRSLLSMAEHYDRYQQMRKCAKEVASLKREATAVGLNPEVLMIQAQDFDGGALPPAENTGGNNSTVGGANNSASAAEDDTTGAPGRHVMLNVNMSAAKKAKSAPDPSYASEGCRILHYALTRDTKGKSLQVCMEAFSVLLRRGYYLLSMKPDMNGPVARDLRNTAALLLNLVQREQDKVDRIVEKIKSGVKKFAHLEEHKQLENRKTGCIQYMAKMVGVLTKLLLHSKILVQFIQSDFPPFNSMNSNFPLNPYLAQKFEEIKFGVIREFNANKDSWIYLNKEMLQTVSGITEMQLRFKVGKIPIIPPKASKNKNKSNMSNTNSCFVSYTRVQRRQRPKAAFAQISADLADASRSASSIDTSSARLAADESDAALHMASSSDCISRDSVDMHYISDLPECSGFGDLMADAEGTGPSVQQPVAVALSTAAAEGDATGKGTSSDMELLLASLCREVDSLFRPLEDRIGTDEGPATVAGTKSAVPGATGSSQGAAGHLEYSTIEPELAPTPMPTPEPSPALIVATDNTAVSSAAASGRREQPQPRVRRPPLSVGLRKKLKHSSVLRLLKRNSAKETDTDPVDVGDSLR